MNPFPYSMFFYNTRKNEIMSPKADGFDVSKEIWLTHVNNRLFTFDIILGRTLMMFQQKLRDHEGS